MPVRAGPANRNRTKQLAVVVALLLGAVGDDRGQRGRALQPLGDEDGLADRDDVGHHDLGVVAERLGEGALRLGLEVVVELLGGAGLQLGDQRLDVDAGDQRRRSAGQPGRAGAGRRRSASPAPGYCTLTATSRPSCQRPRCTWPIDAAAVGPPSSQTSWSFQSGAEVAGQDLADGLGRHRRRRVLQPGELLAVGRRDLVGQRRLEHRQRLAELHRAALELAQRAEQLLGGALLDLGHHGLGRAGRPSACRSPSAVRPA